MPPTAPTARGRLAVDQIARTPFWPHISSFYPDGDGCRGILAPAGQALLDADARFLHGPFSWLHPDIPTPRHDYRAIKGAVGKGSMQIVVSDATGEFWCDIDQFSAYQDVVNLVGHLFGEVIPHWLGRKKNPEGAPV